MDDPLPPTIEWRGDRVRLVDQRRLPDRLAFVDCATVDELCQAIATMAIRGAPALGVAAAMGVALAVTTGEDVNGAAERLRATRPTAVNLAWGLERALAAADPVAEACLLAREDVDRNRRLGAEGAALLAALTRGDGDDAGDGPEGGEGPDGPGRGGTVRVFTHCNAGGLACAGYGTAVGVIRAAHERGMRLHVWVGETRPVLQGARLTAWELGRLGIPCTVVVDSMAGGLMAGGEVDCVVVGADRVAANGDTANKVGTYTLGVLARHHRLPFLVAAPTSTIDLSSATGAAIPIERRAGDEVACVGGRRMVPPGAAVDNRAFDVTPARLVTAVVTEAGVGRPPYRRALAGLVAAAGHHSR